MTPEERCKKTVYTNRGFSSHQCTRKKWKDKFCKIHHPDNVKARQEKSVSLSDYKEEQRKQWLCKDAIRQAQQDAYEECAKLCEGEVPTGYDYPDGDDYAHAIRALKDKS